MSDNLIKMLESLRLQKEDSGAGVMPNKTPLKKPPIPSLNTIKTVIKKDRSVLHKRWAKKRYEQTWKKEFYPRIKMTVEVRLNEGARERVTQFRERPIYPPGTWHKTCVCSFCRQTRFQLMIPENEETIRACSKMIPVSKLKKWQCGDRCDNAVRWNRKYALHTQSQKYIQIRW